MAWLQAEVKSGGQFDDLAEGHICSMTLSTQLFLWVLETSLSVCYSLRGSNGSMTSLEVSRHFIQLPSVIQLWFAFCSPAKIHAEMLESSC